MAPDERRVFHVEHQSPTMRLDLYSDVMTAQARLTLAQDLAAVRQAERALPLYVNAAELPLDDAAIEDLADREAA